MSDKEVIVSDDEGIIWKCRYLITLVLLSIFIFRIFDVISLEIKVNGWSTVQGIVISSEFKECTHQRIKSTFFIIGTDGLLLSKISYSYLINNVTYTGNKIKDYGDNCKGTFFNEDAEKELVNKYRINEKILVYFNSKQPNNSFIFTRDTLGIFDYIGFILSQGIICIIIFAMIQDDIVNIKVILKKDKKELIFFLTKKILNVLLIGWKNIKGLIRLVAPE